MKCALHYTDLMASRINKIIGCGKKHFEFTKEVSKMTGFLESLEDN